MELNIFDGDATFFQKKVGTSDVHVAYPLTLHLESAR